MQTFLNRCALAIRCNSDTYDQKKWTQIEAGSIDIKQKKDPVSVIDLYFSKPPPGGSFSPDASEESRFESWVGYIEQRAKTLLINPSKNVDEIRTGHNVFAIKSLVQIVEKLAIPEARIIGAAKLAGLQMPVEALLAHKHLATRHPNFSQFHYCAPSLYFVGGGFFIRGKYFH